MGYGQNASLWMIGTGFAMLVAVVLMMTLGPLLIQMESALHRQTSELNDIQQLVARQIALLEAISENTRISDAAKSLSRRDEEIESLRQAIHNAIRQERWEAALHLLDEMERRFGYREEADRIREEVDEARNRRIQSRLTEAITMIESHFQAHEWERASAEIERLRNALPEDARVLGLLDRMKVLKEQHKQELKRAWEDACRRNDTDHAIDILRELDRYLSAAEAQALQDSARNVFKEKLLQVGIQFRFAVNEKRWQDALAAGLELIREFPNARMATEVREVLDTLRERARQAAEAAQGVR